MLSAQVDGNTVEIRGRGLVLRSPRLRDFSAWKATRIKYAQEDAAYPVGLEGVNLRTYLARLWREYFHSRRGSYYSFFIFLVQDGKATLVGGVSLSNIRRGYAQHVDMGSWLLKEHSGKGISTNALSAVLPFVFYKLNLHRVHAACALDNIPARKLVEKLGFHQECIAKDYFRVKGTWQDHALYFLTREMFEEKLGIDRRATPGLEAFIAEAALKYAKPVIS